MRVTSPPKHHSQLNKTTSPNSNVSTFYRQSQTPVHHLKSPQRNGPSKAQNSNLKQNLYAQLRNRQHQYVELIRDLNKQNKILKAQLGKISHNQTQRQSFSSILTLSPNKIDMNKTYGASSSDFKVFRNLQSQRVLNQTFSGFHPQKIQHFEPNHIQTHLSPFSKKPMIMSNTSPSGFKTTILANVSPSKKPIKTVRPVSNIVQISNPIIIHSPNKKIINHSYQPSLISYKYPSQNQSLDCSPKKSFQTILGLNSEVFSNSSQVHNANQQQNTHQAQASNSNFFDMKKRQLNYGSIFQRQKNAQSSKSIHTTLKMSTKNYLQNEVGQIKISQKVQTNEVHLNPSTTKRHKVTKSQRSQETEPAQITKNHQEQFKLEQNIDKNPLLNMLKKRLQEEVDFLNNDSQRIQRQSSDSIPFAKSSQYNPNIRYQNERQNDESTHITSIHPLKRNMFQAFPILHKLRNSQKPNQLQQQTLQNEIINQNSQAQNHQENVGTTKQSFKRSSKRVESNLSDKVERQDESQFIIEEVQSCRKTLTIVKMLQQHRKNQDEQIVDLIGMDRESFQQIENKFRENEVEDLFDNNQQQSGQINRISNRYYCQNTQQDDVRVSRSVKQSQVKEERMSRSVKQNVKKVSINENENVFSIMQSHKVLQSMKDEQNNQQNNEQEVQIEQQQFEQKQLMKQIQRQDNDCQRQVQIERQQQNDEQDVVSNSSGQRLNQSSQYRLFYVNKKDNVHNVNQNNQSNKKYHVNNVNNSNKGNNSNNVNIGNNGNNGIMKHRESKLSQSNWSQNTLRSQRFKKISNRAYL